MPWVNGRHIRANKYVELYGDNAVKLPTGPSGENPAEPPDIDPEVGVPVKPKRQSRSKAHTQAVKAAIKKAGAQSLAPEVSE